MFNYILFDLDNTIYNYNFSHEKGLNKLFYRINQEFGINIEDLKHNFKIGKQKFQNYCYGNASSHNKFIQIKKLFEKYNLDLSRLNDYYRVYVDTFESTMELYPGILDFIKFCKLMKIKMYILTNNICIEQTEKLTKLGIINYFDKIYTSEEYGVEKPDIKLFYYIITDIGCSKDEIVKIGDSFKNDIEPLIMNDIYSFWFNPRSNLIIEKEYLEFGNYNNLLVLYQEYYSNLKNFLDISNYVGERFDLVQAGGGNTSFKMDKLMFIKASGCSLSNLDINKNYVGINFINVKKDLYKINDVNKKVRESQSKELVNDNIIFLKNYRPSIETTLHCITKKYTVHIHPIQFNYISSLSNCDSILKEIFVEQYCLIDYFTPGIDVTKELIKYYGDEKVIFLKNHGIVITGDNIEEVYNSLNNVINKLEDYLKINFSRYKLVNYISKCLKSVTNGKIITYLSENEDINKFINNIHDDIDDYFRCFFPDKVVYCGISYVFFTYKNMKKKINEYLQKYMELPKILILRGDIKNYLYISSNNLNKCREIEQVLLSHIICYKNNNIFLDEDEIKYLNNWEAEKYRQIN